MILGLILEKIFGLFKKKKINKKHFRARFFFGQETFLLFDLECHFFFKRRDYTTNLEVKTILENIIHSFLKIPKVIYRTHCILKNEINKKSFPIIF